MIYHKINSETKKSFMETGFTEDLDSSLAAKFSEKNQKKQLRSMQLYGSVHFNSREINLHRVSDSSDIGIYGSTVRV